ncbi:MAG: Glutamyl-tRNA synthetase [Candidatus Uhrbacteria bacterium GW2011_GWE2_45_35]|uniref:Glutamate--tRNA ligase n=2 Tax=Candidatus Uhriibacteriota TaxID=1752732 RepID=A0A0G1JKX8_9BACT|nr:MAG: Glutamyl-tRNA synthetase [Candidatus Uhrbacteria bacterium GW2011_GWF2_44_350]KKU09100.1 MAG: Glutamyl-tRNA synthetase [Candidatus Uhrbacteria bacterium GW2011_GWE2_45_35]HBR80353.1 glutamate--tRNA ligase [Candidatus Uhrbacteria bacterium]HCU31280.1 glutamate--tRNA ligase [Candidatus Uhrbacteria bacterium]
MDDIFNQIAEVVFPESLPDPNYFEELYPPRNLSASAFVTRIAPSPTGFFHIGSLYTALICKLFAHQSDGVFYLRIEDTDKKREVEGSTNLIINTLLRYGLKFDEGPDKYGRELGSYGPYVQSSRATIYFSFIKNLLQHGKAYPCFCSPETLDELRVKQQSSLSRQGYFGQWAVCRHKTPEEQLQELKTGKPFVIRFRSEGSFEQKIKVADLILGTRELPENDQDFVIMKSDKLPTYHFAHAIDDHLMRTTHVIRGDEWFSSVPIHLQLFKALKFEAPKYAHIAPIQKKVGNSKRKLSKRKDPEANIEYFDAEGYPKQAILDYLINLMNSDFEKWRNKNPNEQIELFNISFERLKKCNGALFDFDKLNHISKQIIAGMTAGDLYEEVLKWAKENDRSFASVLVNNADYAKNILSIERGETEKARKDLIKYSDMKEKFMFFFDEYFDLNKKKKEQILLHNGFDLNEVKKIINEFIESFEDGDSKEVWFSKMKEIGNNYNYAESVRMQKNNPHLFRGNIGDMVKIFRILLSGSTQTPDLYSMIKVMGRQRVISRLNLVS